MSSKQTMNLYLVNQNDLLQDIRENLALTQPDSQEQVYFIIISVINMFSFLNDYLSKFLTNKFLYIIFYTTCDIFLKKKTEAL